MFINVRSVDAQPDRIPFPQGNPFSFITCKMYGIITAFIKKKKKVVKLFEISRQMQIKSNPLCSSSGSSWCGGDSYMLF